MQNSKLIDCITFFDNNFMFELRYNILSKHIDYFVICESIYDHAGNKKKINFLLNEKYDPKKIIHIILDKPFPSDSSRWQNQAIQRDYIINNLDFADAEDYIFFSDPDEIIRPELLKKFFLKKKYGIFLQDCFNYMFNLYNPYESPWEGTRVVKKKNLKSIDYMRQKIKRKNLNYSFFRIDKERSIEVFEKGGWHFNNIMSVENISLKLKTFAHEEFSNEKYSSVKVIKEKIKQRLDLFDRGHTYELIEIDENYPDYLKNNLDKFKKYII